MADEKNREEEFQLVILQKVYDMLLYSYPILDNFKKSTKFSLVQDIKRMMDRELELVITAQKKYTKKTTLQELDIANEKLKYYLRLARDLKLLPTRQHKHWSGLVVEIGKMIGGWIKATQGNQPVRQLELDLPEEDDGVEHYCTDCGVTIPQKVNVYSVAHWGKPYCYKCQRLHKGDYKK